MNKDYILIKQYWDLSKYADYATPIMSDYVITGMDVILPSKPTWINEIMAFKVNDRVKAKGFVGIALINDAGTITRVDELTHQYHVKLDKGVDYWFTADELTLINHDSFDYYQPPVSSYNSCSHEFVLYQGLIESFNHCKFCGEKEFNNEPD